METAPVTYRSFRTIFFESGPSVYSVGHLVRDFIYRKSLDSKLAMVFMISSMIYTLMFPTLASAATGYTTSVKAYVPDNHDSNYIRFDQFELLLYVVHDGGRIEQPADFLVSQESMGSK
jgi:hypothetical protein